MNELNVILEKFIACGWDLISVPSQNYLNGECDKETLITAIKEADNVCGSCGCEFDALYKKALELLA